MIRYLLGRLAQAVPVVLGVFLISFVLIRLVPGDPVRTQLGPTATPQAIAFWRRYYGLDLPLWAQFRDFVKNVLTLNLGTSIQYKRPVADVIIGAMGPSLALLAYALIISVVVAVPLALLSAERENTAVDGTVKVLMMVTFTMPSFWIAIILVAVFSLGLGWFPTSGLESGFAGLVRSLTLPALTIGLSLAPVLTRTLRSALIDSLDAEYVEAARARGLSRLLVMVRYVLRNSLVATVTVLGVNLGVLLGGTVIVENVFNIPGVGTATVNAVGTRDFPLVQACVIVVGLFVVICNLTADAVNVTLDPRIRV